VASDQGLEAARKEPMTIAQALCFANRLAVARAAHRREKRKRVALFIRTPYLIFRKRIAGVLS
jgi:hypothetical protein